MLAKKEAEKVQKTKGVQLNTYERIVTMAAKAKKKVEV